MIPQPKRERLELVPKGNVGSYLEKSSRYLSVSRSMWVTDSKSPLTSPQTTISFKHLTETGNTMPTCLSRKA